MTPVVVTAMPKGELKDADVPRPLADDGVPLPANVVTTPEGEILRRR